MKLDEIRNRIVTTATGCWEWQGAKLASGYGSVRFEGKTRVTHRVMWEATKGPVPTDLQLDHLCRNRTCCNPEHLEPVPQAVNLLRGIGFSAVNAAKESCPQGHPFDDENTYLNPRGHRGCRTCRKASRRAHYLRERALLTGTRPTT